MEFQVLCPAPDRSLTAPVPPGRLKARAFSFLIFSALALILAACSGTPKWVSKGGGYMSEKDNKAIYGVGGVTGRRNEPLAKGTGDNDQPAHRAKYVYNYTDYLVRDYSAC